MGSRRAAACGSALKPCCVVRAHARNRRKVSTIMEIVSCDYEDAMEDREWATEFGVTLKGNEIIMALSCDIDVLSVIQIVVVLVTH